MRWIRWAAALVFCFALVAQEKKVSFTVCVKDEAGKPVAGVTVTLQRDLDTFDLNSPTGDTNENGIATIDADDGAYRVTLSGPIVPMDLGDQKPGVIDAVVDRGVALSGHVINADGSSAARANVYLAHSDWFGAIRATDETGAFAFSNVRRGTVKLTTTPNTVIRTEIPQEVSAPADDVVIRLPPTGKVEGKVIDRKTREPLADFGITVKRLDDEIPPHKRWGHASFKTKDGAFALDLPTGAVDLTVYIDGYRSETISHVDVRASKTSGGIVFQLDRTTRIAGHLTSADGSVVGRVMVVLFREDALEQRTEARDKGDYVFEDVTPGEYEIEFSGGGFFSQRKRVSAVAGGETRVDAELTPGLEVRGRVVDSAARGIAAARIFSFGKCGYGSADAAADGSFVMKGLMPGYCMFRGEKKGYVDRQTDFEVHADRPAEPLTITLETGGVITGTIRGVSPEDFAKVRVEAQKGGMREDGEIDAKSGSFRIESVSDGKATVIVMFGNDGSRGARAEVEVRDGAGGPVEIDLAAGFTIRGRVMHNGAPAEGTVSFRTANSATPIGRIAATKDGSYEVTYVGGGECTITFQPRGSSRGILIAKTVFSGDDTYDIDVRGALLEGRVRDKASGQPLEGARVFIEGPRGINRADQLTDREGRFAFDYLDDNPYTIEARGVEHLLTRTSAEIRGGRAPQVELQLPSAEATIFRITDANARPLDAAVSVIDSGGRMVNDYYDSRAKGGVYRTWLPAGTYTAVVLLDGYAEQRYIDVTVPGPEIHVTLVKPAVVKID